MGSTLPMTSLAMEQELCVPMGGGVNPPHDTVDCRAEPCFLVSLGAERAKGGLAHQHHCRSFMSLASPTLSLVGPVQDGWGMRRGCRGWGRHGGRRRPIEPELWWALKPPPDWRWKAQNLSIPPRSPPPMDLRLLQQLWGRVLGCQLSFPGT